MRETLPGRGRRHASEIAPRRESCPSIPGWTRARCRSAGSPAPRPAGPPVAGTAAAIRPTAASAWAVSVAGMSTANSSPPEPESMRRDGRTGPRSGRGLRAGSGRPRGGRRSVVADLKSSRSASTRVEPRSAATRADATRSRASAKAPPISQAGQRVATGQRAGLLSPAVRVRRLSSRWPRTASPRGRRLHQSSSSAAISAANSESQPSDSRPGPAHPAATATNTGGTRRGGWAAGRRGGDHGRSGTAGGLRPTSGARGRRPRR